MPRPRLAVLFLSTAAVTLAQRPFNVVEASIADMRTALEQHRLTSRELVTQYLTRIAFYEDKLHAAITVNPQRARGSRRTRPRARPRHKSAAPSTASPSRSKTTSTPPTCPPPAARSPSTASSRRTKPRWSRIFATPAPSSSPRPASPNSPTGSPVRPTPMPANYNAIGGYGYQSLRPSPRSARRHVRWPARSPNRRLQFRHRHRRQFLGRQRRQRNLGLHPQPFEPEHARGHQAHRRPHQPLRRHSHHRRPGHRRPHGQNRHRRRHHARRARKPCARPQRSRHQNLHSVRPAATTRRSSKPTVSKALASASPALSFTTRPHRPDPKSHAADSTPSRPRS